MKTKFLLVVTLIGQSTAAWSQDCGGMPTVNGVCIPPNSPTSPLNSMYGNQERGQTATYQSRWQLTWGAIAMDEAGDIGVAVGSFSKRKATRKAMDNCSTEGAKHCKLVLAYENQCAVIAQPSQSGESIAGTAITRGGPTIEDASQGALASCSASRGGGECKVIYSDCTKPVLVQ